MENWKLPSQLITTDRQPGETIESLRIRHEMHMRITCERDLIMALDFINSLEKTKEIKDFLAKYLDKTINNQNG